MKNQMEGVQDVRRLSRSAVKNGGAVSVVLWLQVVMTFGVSVCDWALGVLYFAHLG